MIRGTPVSVGTAGLIIGSSTIQMPTAGAANAPVARLTLAGTTLTAQSGQPVVIGGTTLSINGAAVTVGGQTVRVGDSAIVAGTQTIPYEFTAAPAAAIFTVGGRPYTAQPDQPLIIDGTTLSAGKSSAFIDGQTIHLGSSDIVLGTSTIPFENPVASISSEAIVNLGSSSFTAIDQNGHVVVGSKTLSPGDPVATISGEIYSMAPSGVVIDGTTHSFSQISATSGVSDELEAPFSISGALYTAYESPDRPSVAVIVGANGKATTVSVGGSAATIKGQAVSLDSHNLMVADSKIWFNSVPVTGTIGEAAKFTDPSGHIHTAWEGLGDGPTAVVDGSIPMTVGGSAVTIDGVVVSLASSALVVNGTSSVGFAFTSAEHSGGIETGSSGGSDPMVPSTTGIQDPNISGATRRLEVGSSALASGFGTIMVSLLIHHAT